MFLAVSAVLYLIRSAEVQNVQAAIDPAYLSLASLAPLAPLVAMTHLHRRFQILMLLDLEDLNWLFADYTSGGMALVSMMAHYTVSMTLETLRSSHRSSQGGHPLIY